MFPGPGRRPAEHLAMVTNVTDDSSEAQLPMVRHRLQGVTGITIPPAPRAGNLVRVLRSGEGREELLPAEPRPGKLAMLLRLP